MKKILIIVCLFLMTGCGQKELKEVIIDTSDAIDRSIVNLIREEKILEKYLPSGISVKWKNMSSGSARKDALLAGDVQFIAVTSSQFFIYTDSGMPITLINSLSKISTSIYSNNPKINKFEDFDKAKKIVANSMTSDDYMLFKKMAYETFGDYNYFDDKMSFMDEVDIMTSLKSSKDIDVAILPYVYAKQADEISSLKKIFDSGTNEPFERYLVTTTEFYNKYPYIIEAFMNASLEAAELINNDIDRVSEILAPVYEIDAKMIKEFFVKYPASLEIKGYDEAASLLYDIRVIENKPKKLSELPNYTNIPK